MCSIDYCENKLYRPTVLDRPTVLVRQSDIMQVQDAWMTALLSVYPMIPLSWNLHNPSYECSYVCGKRHKGREWRTYEWTLFAYGKEVQIRWRGSLSTWGSPDKACRYLKRILFFVSPKLIKVVLPSMWTGQTTDASGVAVHVDDPSCRHQNQILLWPDDVAWGCSRRDVTSARSEIALKHWNIATGNGYLPFKLKLPIWPVGLKLRKTCD